MQDYMKSDKFSLEGKKNVVFLKIKVLPSKRKCQKKFIKEILTVHFNVAD